MSDETKDVGLTKVEKVGEAYRIEGIKDGQRVEGHLSAQSVEEYARKHGARETQDMLKRQIEAHIDYQREERQSS